MSKFCIILLAAMAAFGADDPWAKVKDLNTGTELRIYKRDAKQPILAKMDELNDDALVVVVKNEQIAIRKDDIERIDYRPSKGSSRVVNQTRTTTDTSTPDSVGPRPQGSGRSGAPSTSSSSSVQFGGKADFETIYRRTQTLPAKKD